VGETGTPTPRTFLTRTPTVTVTVTPTLAGPVEEPQSRGPWLPVLIILSGVAILAGLAWYLWKHNIISLPFLPPAGEEDSAGNGEENENFPDSQ
jgi:hypothetical protein